MKTRNQINKEIIELIERVWVNGGEPSTLYCNDMRELTTESAPSISAAKVVFVNPFTSPLEVIEDKKIPSGSFLVK